MRQEDNLFWGMLNKSIAYRLSIYVSLAVIAVFLAFILLLYNYNQKLVKDNVTGRAQGQSMDIFIEVEKLLVSTREITSNISEQFSYYNKNNDADIFVSNLMRKYPYINAIHVNLDSINPVQNNSGFLFIRENESIIVKRDKESIFDCLREELLFKALKKQSVPQWSSPYKCSRNENVVVAYYTPITVAGENNQRIKVGEIISELSLLDLNDQINSVKIGKRGFAFLLANNGDYITHPKKEWILNRNIFEVSEKIYDRKRIDIKKIFSENESGWVKVYPEILDFEKTMVYYSPIKENNWLLIFAIPYNELFEPLYMILLRMMFISVLGILAIYLIVTYITNKLIEPLSNATQKLKKFSSLSGEKIVTSNEIKQIDESLEFIQKWYKRYLVNLTREEQKSQQRKQDLLQASEIQQSLIKTEFPAFPEREDINLAGLYKPVKIVSGDLYDFFFIDEENLIITIGDVSGKGIPAAIFMSVALTIIKGNSKFKLPRTIVNKVNKELHTNNQHQFFLTLFLGVLNVKTGVLNYCNAAHTTSYILKENGEIVKLSKTHGLPLGLYPDKEYTDTRITIKKGDTIILYSDGVIDQRDNDDNQFGAERFRDKLHELLGQKPELIVSELDREFERFSGESKFNDDISLLVLKYNPD